MADRFLRKRLGLVFDASEESLWNTETLCGAVLGQLQVDNTALMNLVNGQ